MRSANDNDGAKKRKAISKEELIEVMDDIEYHSLEVGEKWYVISMKWWKDVAKAMDDGSLADISRIDNSTITTKRPDDEYDLSPDLLEKRDFITVPESAFDVLVNCFGLKNEDRDIIERAVINDKRSGNMIEVYSKVFTIFIGKDRNKKITVSGRNHTIGTLRKSVLNSLRIDFPTSRIRIFVGHRNVIELMSDLNDEDECSTYFCPERPIIFDFLDENGQGSIQTWHNMDSAQTSDPQFTKGACGLVNLGHTCYMNSALQCISNIPELTQFFLSEQYLVDINEANTLGTQGKLAHAYANLVKSLWSGKHESIIHRNFKTTIGQFATRFSGFAREDAQELLACLLDGLHEDLNRVKVKPYIEERDPVEGTSQAEIADEAWSNYKKRNDSIVIDKCHGQLRSTLVCPQCKKISIKFDPFCFLSVPVPATDDVVPLVDCLNLFTKEEQLSEQDSWYCPQCKEHVRATKKLDLWKLPPILIVHLKRFQSTRWAREKIETRVEIPGRDFNLQNILADEAQVDAMYDLIAVSHHDRGGLADGHYNASALNGDTWYYFNDARVSVTTPPYEVPNDSPYILVYRRKNLG